MESGVQRLYNGKQRSGKLKRESIWWYSLVLLVVTTQTFHAQENQEIQIEQSSEVFLEEYTDQFQERFFEALKQKGIQNYDRAINLFLECKQIDPDNPTVAHELAKAYTLEKQYANAKAQAFEALRLDPDNYWYLNTLVGVLEAQGEKIEDNKDIVPFTEVSFQKHLSLIYFRTGNYSKALTILSDLESSDFTQGLIRKINDSLAVASSEKQGEAINSKDDPNVDTQLLDYKKETEQLYLKGKFAECIVLAIEAKETYPLQPYFYYFQGAALLMEGNVKEAISNLEEGLEYVFDDDFLANKFYKTLSEAFTRIGDPSKAAMYANKIKSGS